MAPSEILRRLPYGAYIEAHTHTQTHTHTHIYATICLSVCVCVCVEQFYNIVCKLRDLDE